jgi:hypothetical protein
MPHGQGEPPSPDPQAQARDWITIWQSELTAIATDREAVDAWTRLVTLWAGTAERAARLLPGAGAPDGAAGRAGPAAPAGAAAPLAAFDARDATIQRLADRVAELERKLAQLAQGGGRPDT